MIHDISETLKRKLDVLPGQPGVYKMVGKKNEVLYVGKARNLKHRVRSYFTGTADRQMVRHLISRIRNVEIIITHTEKEALLLENNLVKTHQPYFNIDLKDNKTYPYLKLTTHEKFPRLLKTREKIEGQGRYFGPFTDLSRMYHYLDMLNEIYPLKKCRRQRFPAGFKPCLYYHIDKCLPYCTGSVSREEIHRLNRDVLKALNGGTKFIRQVLMEKIRCASKKQNYESALTYKQQLEVLEDIDEKQKVSLMKEESIDVMHHHLSEGMLTVVVLHFRGGWLIDKRVF